MSFGGSVSAMITAIKNNAQLRIKRNRFFDLKGPWGNKRPFRGKTKKLTQAERLAIRAKMKHENQVQTFKTIFGFFIAIIITSVLVIILSKITLHYL